MPDTNKHWFWLSFCDGTRPVGTQSLGIVIVGPAKDFMSAVLLAHELKINPGGEVQGVRLSDRVRGHTADSDLNRLLTLDAAKAIDAGWNALLSHADALPESVDSAPAKDQKHG